MLKVKPNSKSTYYHLANLYKEMKNIEKEIEMLEEGVKIKPIIEKLIRLGISSYILKNRRTIL